MIKLFNIFQAEQWDVIVRSFRGYDVFWLSGYVKAFQIHGDGEPLLFYFESDECRGINVVMKRDIATDSHFLGKIPLGKYYDFATPYGYGGWLIEGKNTRELFLAYEKWIHDNYIISEFVRFHPIVENHEVSRSFYEIVQLGEIVYMNLESPELIWNNIISKNRNMIRKAIKNGVVIYNGRFPDIFKTFRAIYNGTMNNDNAEDYYYFTDDFYKSILHDLSQNAQVFWAEKDGRVIAASILLATNGMMNYHLSGSLREFNCLAPTNLLLYEAALWGCANGCKTLYLGGGVGSREDGLLKFKKSFNKNGVNNFYIGKKIYNKNQYEKLLDMRKNISNPGFFPKYRG